MPVFTRPRRTPEGVPASDGSADSPAGAPDAESSAEESANRAEGERRERIGASSPWRRAAGAARAWPPRLRPSAARVRGACATTLAASLLLASLLLPGTLEELRATAFLRIPGEAIVAAVLLPALPRRARVPAAAFAGAVLGTLTLLNLLDLGFHEYLGRGFNPVLDWGLLDDAQSFVADSMGGGTAVLAAVGAVALVLLLPALMAWAAARLTVRIAARRAPAARATLAAGTVWVTASALGLQLFGAPLAADQAASAVERHVETTVDTLRDEAAFAREAGRDTFGATPGDALLTELRGKDVIFAFIESYGRTALEDPLIAPGVGRALEEADRDLTDAGFGARSGWLTSSTFGAGSWLGHSTFMSGLWIDNQQRYRTVMAGDRLSLTKAFGETGAWDTVGVMPGVQKAWPEAEFYGLDQVYDAFELGYRGPKFSWSTMPDQYTLDAFQRLEHGRERERDLMALVILTSSHQPWAPIPRMVDWDELGDGRIFGPIEEAGEDPAKVIADSTLSREEYGESVEYSITSLTEWLRRHGEDDTVLVFLGDHQPRSRVTGPDASRDVPVTIVARDPSVLDRIADWEWTEGLRPAGDAPVWRMDAFRDRFLTAYGSTSRPSGE